MNLCVNMNQIILKITKNNIINTILSNYINIWKMNHHTLPKILNFDSKFLHPDKHTLYLATQSWTENPLMRIYQFKFEVSIITLNYTF